MTHHYDIMIMSSTGCSDEIQKKHNENVAAKIRTNSSTGLDDYNVQFELNKGKRDSILNLSKSKRQIIKLLSVDDSIFIFL